MRTRYSMYNIFGALIGQFLGVAAQFVARRVFIYYLSQTYLGLSGLFSNIISVLSLVELGSGVAMTYSLYKPIADKNIELIKSLMAIYHKIYLAIGCLILGIGFLITPLYPLLINEMPEISHLTLIYWIYVINTAITYFYSYKRTLIICDQKRYIYSLIHYGMYALGSVLQIIALVITGNYIAYLVCLTVSTVLENIIITVVADRKYPYLKDKEVSALPIIEVSEFKKNISAMFMHKIGGMVISSTDNIVISKYIGLIEVGIYSNYLLITEALSKIALQFFQAITPSIGNLLVDSDEEHINDVFYITFYLGAMLYGTCTVCMICGFQPMIKWYAGSNYLLDYKTVLLICVSFYITGMRKTVLAFRDASATYYYDRYKSIAEAVMNLVLSVVLVQKVGISGVILGTILSAFFLSLWIEPFVLHKYVLKTSMKKYIVKFLYYSLSTIIIGLLCITISNYVINQNLFVVMLVRIFLSFIIYLVSYWLIFYKTQEAFWVRKMFIRYFNRGFNLRKIKEDKENID